VAAWRRRRHAQHSLVCEAIAQSIAVAVAYGTRIGTDRFSQRIDDFIANADIETTWIQRDTKRTAGLYAINLDGGERSFSYWRSQSAARHFADDPVWLARALHASDLIYLSGITLAILTPQAQDNLLAALALARQSGQTIAFDPNIRASLWSSSTHMREVIMRAASVSHWVLPSFDDEQAALATAPCQPAPLATWQRGPLTWW